MTEPLIDTIRDALDSICYATQPGLEYIKGILEPILPTDNEENDPTFSQLESCVNYLETVRPDINPNHLLEKVDIKKNVFE